MTETECKQISKDCEELVFTDMIFDSIVGESSDPLLAGILVVRVLLGNALAAYRAVLEMSGIHQEHAEAEVDEVARRLYDRLLNLKYTPG